MKTIEYQLKSDPKVYVKVPEDSAKNAKEILNLAMETKGILDLSYILEKNPYLTDGGILKSTIDLIFSKDGSQKTQKYLKIQDEIYLKVCLKDAEKANNKSVETVKIKESLNEIIESLKRMN